MKLELFYPLKPFIVGQKFGQSDACCENKIFIPIAKRKVVGKRNGVCPAGFVELYPLLGMKGHTGIDLYAKNGQKIYASQDGTVIDISTEFERGLGVDVVTDLRYDMGEHGTHYAKYRNWHMKSINVVKGQKVKAGDILGEADNTGLSSGDHDHFELKPVEMADNGMFYNTEQNNGYFGSIDPLPYFNEYHAEDSVVVVDILTKLKNALKQLIAMLT
jgi:murein DD-endopeptidase MepM/ murein hydrolase activator NlpD